MKFKKVMLMALLLLTILTITTVSATENLDNLTVEDSIDESIELKSDTEVLTEDDDDSPLEKVNANYNVNFPDETIYGDDDYEKSIYVYIYDENVTGNISISINDETFVDNQEINPRLPLYSNTYCSFNTFSLKNAKFRAGENKVVVSYSGNDILNPFNETDTIYYQSHMFHVYSPNDDTGYINSEVPYYIYIRGNANSLTVTCNGKRYDIIQDGNLKVQFKDFNLGPNNITFTYKCSDSEEMKITRIFNALPKITIPVTADYGNSQITVEMPSDATGNIVIYTDVYNQTTHSYDWIEIGKAPVKEGKASWPINLSIGRHNVKLAYDGKEYGKYFDNFNYSTIDVVPGVIGPLKFHVDEISDIKIILPDDGNETLEVTLRKYGGYNNKLYNKITNGTVIIPLPDLEIGEYYIDVRYGKTNTVNLVITNNSRDFKWKVDFPDEVMRPNVLSNNAYFTVNAPEDFNGKTILYINGIELKDLSYYNGKYYFQTEFWSGGNFTWEVKITGDDYYQNYSLNGTSVYKLINVPKDMDEGFYIFHDIGGFIEFYVDGEMKYTSIMWDGMFFITLMNCSIGKHNYTVLIYDENNSLKLNESGEFNLDYSIGISFNEEYYYSDIIECEVYLPRDAEGYLNVTYDGVTQTFEVRKDTTFNLTFSKLTPEINFTYWGDKKYPTKSIIKNPTQNFHICGIYDDNYNIISLSLTLPNDANGTLVIYNKNQGEWQKYDSIDLVNGKAFYKFSKIGKYDFLAEYENDAKYNVDSYSNSVTVLPEIEIPKELMIGENGTVELTLPGAKGNITIYLDNAEIFKGEVNKTTGKITAILNGSNNLGDHTITFDYNGSDIDASVFEMDDGTKRKYNFSIIPGNFIVPDELELGTGNITMDLVIDGNVTIYTYDDEVVDIIVSNYPVSGHVVLPIEWHYSYFSILIRFSNEKYGMYEYLKQRIESLWSYDKNDVKVPETVEGNSLKIILPDNNTGAILVTIDGKSQCVQLKNGVGNADLSGLSFGEHDIILRYPGSWYLRDFEIARKFTLLNGSSSQDNGTNNTPAEIPAKITAKDLTMQYYDGTKYSVTVYGTDGKVASGVVVTFLIDGKKLGTAKTDGKGVASIKITKTPKTYKITSEALGVKVTKKLTVKQILTLKKVKVKRSAKKLVLTATLKKVKGKYLKDKKITFKFNGKKYTAKTNKKGVAKVTVKKKVLKKLKKGKKVTYTATYLKNTVKKTVKVQK
ncbi:hypothetical protein [Methanobrevibacter sp.]